MIKASATHPILATHVKSLLTTTVMERGHAHGRASAKGQLAEEQMIKKKSYLQFIFFNSNK